LDKPGRADRFRYSQPTAVGKKERHIRRADTLHKEPPGWAGR